MVVSDRVREQWVPIAVLAVVIVAYVLGISLTQPTLVGGFDFGVLVMWLLIPLLPVVLLITEFRSAGGNA